MQLFAVSPPVINIYPLFKIIYAPHTTCGTFARHHGFVEYRKDTAGPIRELTQLLLRGPSTLTEGERELIATVVSHGNECRFCTTAHT